MSTWGEINNLLISRARESADPIGELLRLFEAERHDGAAAFALGKEYELRGDVADALLWFETAEQRFPGSEDKAKARRATERIRGQKGEPTRTSTSEPLYVVSCTKAKIWDDLPVEAPRFVPAELAYTGRSMHSWRDSELALSDARWLVLSAKYGFIEPDHPIARYDVSFSDPDTGPISDATLAGQAGHQTRWGDARPPRSFQRVVVRGSQAYRQRVERAFAPLGIPVVSWEERGEAGAAPPQRPPESAESDDRAQAVGRALGELPAAVFDAADRGEPEWPVLERLAALPNGLDVMATLALALSDYKLGSGGADAYWRQVSRLLDGRDVRTVDELRGLMGDLMATPVAGRLADRKLARADRLLASDTPRLVEGGVATVDGRQLWDELSLAIGGARDAKTIVFAMKTMDLLHRISTGRRMELPDDLPIPVDLRIARLSLAAGLIEPPSGVGVREAIEDVEQLAADRRGEIIGRWQVVGREVGLAPPAMDSLLWQLSGPLQVERRSRSGAAASLSALMRGYGAPSDAAQAAAFELTWALDTAGSSKGREIGV